MSQWTPRDEDCRCAECKFPPMKRPRLRRSAPTSALSLAVDATPFLSVATPSTDPIFVLERLAHIRCLSLTVCGPGGSPLLQAMATVTGSQVELRCLLGSTAEAFVELDSTGSGEATGSWSGLHLDVGEEIDGSAAGVQLARGYAYLRLPLAVPPPLVLSEGEREASHFRTEVGLTCRAAEQRRRERAHLRGALPCCRACGALICQLQGDVRAMPDVDAAAMVDFIQCCQELSFEWGCLFPPPDTPVSIVPAPPAAADDAPPVPPVRAGVVCFMASHVLLTRAPPPPSTVRCPDEVFAEPRSFRNDFREGSRGGPRGRKPSLWEPLRCAQCSVVLGAAKRDDDSSAGEGRTRGQEAGGGATGVAAGGVAGEGHVREAPMREAPIWFEQRFPPELGCSLQLLKSRVTVRSEGASTDANEASDRGVTDAAAAAPAGGTLFPTGSNVSDAAGEDLFGTDIFGSDLFGSDLFGSDPIGSDPVGSGPVGSGPVGSDIFGGYSMGSVVAAEILRALEEEGDEEEEAEQGPAADGRQPLGRGDPRLFVLGPSPTAPCLSIRLLNPFVTLHTNHPAAAHLGGSHPTTDPPPADHTPADRTPADQMPADPTPADPTPADPTQPESARDVLKVLYAPCPLPAGQLQPPRPPRWLCLGEEECAEILRMLQASSTLMPPDARQLGTLRVSYLPVAPTWD